MSPADRPPRFPSLRNWVSASGAMVAFASVFAFLLLFVLNLFAGTANPYLGVLTYLVAPAFLFLGLGLVVLGMLLRRRQLARYGEAPTRLVIDLTRSADRRGIAILLAGGIAFLLLTAVGSYGTYEFTESVTFCGQTCHTVMQPEWVTYQHSPHARVSCAECHIGSGATWWVRSKLSGTYQVYAVLADVYPRPIPTPIENLRPARETCEECHWPDRFSGDLVRTHWHYLSDEDNTPYAIRMLLKVGGGDPERGPVAGIHWHIGVKMEYYASDERRQEIPWIRLTDRAGETTVFRASDYTDDPPPAEIRTMDCIDCHNRPAHVMDSPHEAVDFALHNRDIDPSIPNIRASVAELLVGQYDTQQEATRKISEALQARYPDDPRVEKAIPAVQQLYRDNFFPGMKARWDDYPQNIGHMIWPGCTRCHDDDHVSDDGSKTISFRDCETCHVILAQGSEDSLGQLQAEGQTFDHPAGMEYDPSFPCVECHTGGP